MCPYVIWGRASRHTYRTSSFLLRRSQDPRPGFAPGYFCTSTARSLLEGWSMVRSVFSSWMLEGDALASDLSSEVSRRPNKSSDITTRSKWRAEGRLCPRSTAKRRGDREDAKVSGPLKLTPPWPTL
ncbi:hypothetical protein AAFF_G00146410 [Aldrovandia affinis]|uniref:Uncharacterized protein n=1 Tax=Aldrovandia affinis TaxID=143900 RepID=A0AAD7RQ37_9TELE|nr:hypothetical protein AAFF_G00146410 [Aldrovandia affinis]